MIFGKRLIYYEISQNYKPVIEKLFRKATKIDWKFQKKEIEALRFVKM